MKLTFRVRDLIYEIEIKSPAVCHHKHVFYCFKSYFIKIIWWLQFWPRPDCQENRLTQTHTPTMSGFIWTGPCAHSGPFCGALCRAGWGGPEHLANVAKSVGWDCTEVLAQQSETAELELFPSFASLWRAASAWTAGAKLQGRGFHGLRWLSQGL